MSVGKTDGRRMGISRRRLEDGKTEGRRLGRSRIRLEDNVKVRLNLIWYKSAFWLILVGWPPDSQGLCCMVFSVDIDMPFGQF